MISVFDTSIANYNLGNEIIMDAVNQELDSIFQDEMIIKLPTEDIKNKARSYNCQSKLTFVGGTNLLNSNLLKYRQWDLTPRNAIFLKRCILMGCGWFQYETINITNYSKWALNRILSKEYIHSVRDEYTKNKLTSIGITSINTGCPTLWKLDEKLQKINGRAKSADCVVTFTDYNQNPERDLKIFNILKQNYDNLFLFPQGSGDLEYLSNLGILNEFKLIPPRITHFNNLLDAGLDYVGTRLHAGIRALQKDQRSLIIGIDNRAIEMNNDFNIPVVKQEDINALHQLINKPFNTILNLPKDNIELWKKQFLT